MAEKKEQVLRSEATKDFTEIQFKAVQEEVEKMTGEELLAYRNEHDVDSMGFDGAEGV